jgi:hypothetical protein
LQKTALQIVVKLDAHDPTLVYLTLDHGHILMDIGHILWRQRNPEALNYYLQALPLREELVRTTNNKVNRNMLAKCHFHLYQVYRDSEKNSLQALKHYFISSMIDPAYCKPLVDPGEMMQLMAMGMSWISQPGKTFELKRK